MSVYSFLFAIIIYFHLDVRNGLFSHLSKHLENSKQKDKINMFLRFKKKTTNKRILTLYNAVLYVEHFALVKMLVLAYTEILIVILPVKLYTKLRITFKNL